MINIKDLNIKSDITFISYNGTIFVNNIDPDEITQLPEMLIKLIDNCSFKKIMVKTPLRFETSFIKNGYYREAYIPNFFSNGDGCSYVSYIDNLETFVNGEYRYIKNRLLELMGIKEVESNEDEEIQLVEIKTDYKKINSLIDSLSYPVINDIRNNSNSTSVDKNINLIGNSNCEQSKPLMLLYHNPESDVLEILDMLANKNPLISSLVHYCEEYSKNNNIRMIHMLTDIENPAQNFVLKQNGFNYGGTLIAKKQDGNPKRNFNVWYKNLKGN